MTAAYNLGYLFGTFAAGCIFGLFPLIVAILKKRAKVGAALMAICGLLGFIHPVLSVALAIVSGIVLCFKKKNV